MEYLILNLCHHLIIGITIPFKVEIKQAQGKKRFYF
jgi:hypothetical protein